MACKEETRTPADLPPDLPTHSLPSNLSFPMLVPSSISSLNEPRPPDGRPYSPPHGLVPLLSLFVPDDGSHFWFVMVTISQNFPSPCNKKRPPPSCPRSTPTTLRFL